MKPVRYLIAFVSCALSPPVLAQGVEPDVSEVAAKAALAALSVAATPNDILPSFNFLSASGPTRDFRSTQIRGGFKPLENNLYIEWLAAYQNYNPVLIFPEIAPGRELDVTWASIAGTVGVGWEFPLGRDWTVRPVGHLSFGHVSTDAILSGSPLSRMETNPNDDADGNLDAVGVGASLSLLREEKFGLLEGEYRIRQTFLKFYPIDEPLAGDATARSNQTTLFARHRYPLPKVRPFKRPTRLVIDTGVAFFHGDSATVLDTDWMVSTGLGLEVDTGTGGKSAIRAGRIMLNGVFAQDFNGVAIGFGLSF